MEISKELLSKVFGEEVVKFQQAADPNNICIQFKERENSYSSWDGVWGMDYILSKITELRKESK